MRRRARRRHRLPDPRRLLDRPLCGDYGGRALNGRPCGRRAGFGVPGAGAEGRCADHRPDTFARMRALKSVILEAYATGKVTLEQAARIAGVDPATVWRWREADRRFDGEVTALQDAADVQRFTRIEETLVDRLERGEATEGEYMRWLVAHGKGRWSFHPPQAEDTGGQGGPIVTPDQLRDLLRDDDAPPGAGARGA